MAITSILLIIWTARYRSEQVPLLIADLLGAHFVLSDSRRVFGVYLLYRKLISKKIYFAPEIRSCKSLK